MINEHDDLVGRLRREGVQESEGNRFTLDLAGQAARMAQYQNREPALWLLKAVQAAVAARSPEVRIQLTRNTLDVRFQAASPPDLKDGATGYSRHLRLALQSALSQQPPALTLSYGHSILYSLGSSPVATTPGLRLHLRRPPRPWWSFSDSQLAAIHRTLTWRCALCPIPVWLDGRRINLPAPEKIPSLGSRTCPTNWGEGAVNYHWLAERSWLAPTGDAFALGCPANRPGTRIVVSDKGAWDSPHIYSVQQLNPASLYLHLESEAEVQQVEVSQDQLALPRPSLVSPPLLAGAAAQRDWTRVIPLAFDTARFESSGSNQVVQFYSKVTYLNLDPTPQTSLQTAYGPLKLRLSTMACSRWLGLAAHSDSPGGLYYIQDGILLDPIESGARFGGTTALVADPQVETDLSQLTVIQDARLEADRTWIHQEEERLLASSRSAVVSQTEGERLQVPISMRLGWRRSLS